MTETTDPPRRVTGAAKIRAFTCVRVDARWASCARCRPGVSFPHFVNSSERPSDPNQGRAMHTKKLAIVVAASGIIALGGAAPAWASTGSVRIGSTSTIVAKGAAATLTVHYTCPSSYTGYVSGSLTQVTRQRLTNNGSSYADITCTGSPQTTKLYISGTYGWKRGEAFASASLSACNADYSDCVNISTSRVVTLT